MDYLNNLEPLLRIFWYIALPTSILFIVQSIMTFLGSDSSEGINADFDSNLEGNEAPGQLFSFRNLLNFLLGFSWSGISFYGYIANPIYLILLAFLIGILFVFIFFLIIKQVQKLAEDNTFKIKNTLNKTAEVYLKIPASRSGKGKIMISVNGSFHELEAITAGNAIPSGTFVKVIKIENDQLLLVETI
jgi:hypothetical protein